MKIQSLNESYLNFEKALLTYYNGAEPVYSLTDAIANYMDNNRLITLCCLQVSPWII